MNKNPYSDGKIQSHLDRFVRVILIALIVFVSWNTGYIWYWRLAIFIGLMFILGIVYPAVLLILAQRKERIYQSLLEDINPTVAQYEQETKEFVERMNSFSKSYSNKADFDNEK